MRKQQPQRNFK